MSESMLYTASRTPAFGSARRSRRRVRGVMLTAFIAVITVFTLEYSIYVVRSDAFDKLIKATAFLALVLAFPYQRPNRKFLIVLFFYAAIFFFAALPALVSLDALGLLQLAKIIVQFATLPLIVLRFLRDLPPSPRLLRQPILWAVLFAIQGLILFALVITGTQPEPGIVYLGQLDNMAEKSFGIFGYGNTFTVLANGSNSVRPQAWFLEPSNLSGFLIYPVFMSWGLYRSLRQWRYLAAAAICLVGALFAFSLTGYMALGAAALSLLLIRPAAQPMNRTSTLRRLIAPILIAVAFLVFANYLMEKMYVINDSASGTTAYYLLGRSRESQKLLQDYWGLDAALEMVRSNPFGIGLANTLHLHESTSANAVIFWMVAAGIPGVVLVLGLYVYLFYVFVIPALSSRAAFCRAAAAGFIGTTVQGLQYGNWMNPWYLFTVAMVILCGLYADRSSGRSA